MKEEYFTDPDGDKLSCTAKRRNGEDIPTWLTYSDFWHSFKTDKVPTVEELAGDEIIDIKVTCVDPYGKSAYQTFYINIYKEETVSNGQVMAAAISAAVVLIGAPLITLSVVKVMAARKAVGAFRGAYSAVRSGQAAAAPSAPRSAFEDPQPVSSY